MKVILIHESEAESLRKDLRSVAVLLAAGVLGTAISNWVGVVFVLMTLLYIVASVTKEETVTTREQAKARIDAIFDKLEKDRAEG